MSDSLIEPQKSSPLDCRPIHLHFQSTPALKHPIHCQPPELHPILAAADSHCPADIGDPLYSPPAGPYTGTCFYGWGNSYLMSWFFSEFGVEFVGGECDVAGTAILSDNYPNKRSRIAIMPATKIILGDWNWFGNRHITSPQTSWHAYKGRRVIPFLFGDGHNEVWSYSPADENEDDTDAPPNLQARFW
jgi:hypothetical protein